MEVVRTFNKELTSLYESKPPISKAKMTQITKSAIKGIKFYKHIVQSVEKFIQKCRPEYKVPGLYVVDSIVRQSRHQFGADKDVFGPRFVKNISQTFHYLFKCNPDDRPKIIRVLNLWQKNAVFPIDVIQPLLDMGHPNSSSEWSNDQTAETKESPHKSLQLNEDKHKPTDNTSWKGWPQANDEPVPEDRTYAEMSTKNLEKFMKAEMSNALEEEQFRKTEKQAEETAVKFNKKLLDFDYGDEDEEEETKNEDNIRKSPSELAKSMAQNLLSNPELLRQLQQMQCIQQNDGANSDQGLANFIKSEPIEPSYSSNLPPPSPQQPPLPPVTMGAYPPVNIKAEGDKDDRMLPEVPAPPRDLDERSLAAILAPLERAVLPPMPFTEASGIIPYQNNAPFPPQQPPLPLMDPMSMDGSFQPALPPDSHLMQGDEDERKLYSMPGEPPLPPQDFDERTAVIIPGDERSKKDRSRSRSGSRSRGRSGRHRSRSRSPRRKRSRSRSRSRKGSRAEERERIREKEQERERERQRRRKGLPPIKKGCISVCSRTLWLGHVPKSCNEKDISEVFEEFGAIISIDMIPPRGCAYVVMEKREDANKAIQKLKKLKIQSSLVKMAWAPGKGVKGKEYKEYWEVNLGVSYVPCEMVSESVDALQLLEEGGYIDEESLPDNLKALRNLAVDKSIQNSVLPVSIAPVTTSSYNPLQAPPMVPPPIMPPNAVNLPGMVLPHLMQPQFGLPLPGLLPPQAMVMQMPMGIPPPNPMLMVQQQSQNLLNSMGLPQMIPRGVPPVASTLQNLKSSEPPVNSPAIPAGDATPTDEDGTSIPTSSTVMVTSSVSTTSIPVSSHHVTQFNHMLGLQNVNRTLMSVPPPVSSAGTPIPYPPPHVSFNFPPPGVRPPGQLQSPQFPWMQSKPSNAPPSDNKSSQLNNTVPSRTTPQQAMPHHGFGNRPPFPENSLPPVQSVSKDGHDGNSIENKKSNNDSSGNRASPGHHDMVISTDDESSVDRDYPRNEPGLDPRFQGPTEFPRLPMGMHPGRGPPGPMQNMRFQRGGPPFGPPMRMGGPRGMNMHPGPRMEHDFPMHGGPPGSRMPGGQRRDGQPPEGRDWYPRDFDGPPFEQRDNRYERDDWQRDAWGNPDRREMNPRERRPRDFNDPDERQGSRSRYGDDRIGAPRDNHGDRHDGRADQRNDRSDRRDSQGEQRIKPAPEKADEIKPSPAKKSKPNKSLLDDMLKLRFYQRDKNPNLTSQLNKKLEKQKEQSKNKTEEKDSKKEKNLSQTTSNNNTPSESIEPQKTIHKEVSNENNGINLKKDREARKRSRWGRTLSEERDFQEQRRNEIEMKRSEIERKFQNYEQSSQASQQLLPDSNGIPCDNSTENNSDAIAPETLADKSLSDSLPVSEDNEKPIVEQTVVAAENSHSKCETEASESESITINNNSESNCDFGKEIDSSLVESTVDAVSTDQPSVSDTVIVTES